MQRYSNPGIERVHTNANAPNRAQGEYGIDMQKLNKNWPAFLFLADLILVEEGRLFLFLADLLLVEEGRLLYFFGRSNPC
jgi:hypothetical protein